MRKDSALPEAAFDDDVAAVKRLVKRGVHLESVDESGQTALGNAALAGNVALVKFLLAAGANAEHVSPKWRSSPLHLAAEANAPDVVKVLLEAGTKPTLKDSFGQTALDVALERKHTRVIAVLAPERVAAPVVKKKASPTPRLPKPPPTAFTALSSLETWRAATTAQRKSVAEKIADTLGDEWTPTGALHGREQLAEVLHQPTSVRFVAIPAGSFLSGLRQDEVELAQTLDWQEPSTLELFAPSKTAPAIIATFLCARAPVSTEPMTKKQAEQALKRTPFRVLTPLEWEYVARDGGASPFISARTPAEAEAACAKLYGAMFDPKKKDSTAFGVWGLPLGEWVSSKKSGALTGACGGAAMLYPWQGDELVECFAGLRESANANTQNPLRFAFSLPR
ncbi:MAG: ankyrin repeat domain-containing protein [Myxococcaceae bacterium]